MTRQEAYKVFRELLLSETFLSGFEGIEPTANLNDCFDTFNFDELIEYFETLEVPVKVVIKFVNGSIDFTDMNDKPTGDDWDNLEIYKDKNGKLGMYVWTEVFGRTYDIADYNKTWKERVYPEIEISEETRADFKKFCIDLTTVAIPKLVADDYKVYPMSDYREYLKAAENKFNNKEK